MLFLEVQNMRAVNKSVRSYSEMLCCVQMEVFEAKISFFIQFCLIFTQYWVIFRCVTTDLQSNSDMIFVFTQ